MLAGGDGAYTAGVTAFVHACEEKKVALPRFAFAPGGTVSTTARNWGLHGALVPYAQKLIDAIASDRAREDRRPSLRVTDDDGGDRVGFIWGAGLVARFFDAYYASPHTGYAGAARIVARIFLARRWRSSAEERSRAASSRPCRAKSGSTGTCSVRARTA